MSSQADQGKRKKTEKTNISKDSVNPTDTRKIIKEYDSIPINFTTYMKWTYYSK